MRLGDHEVTGLSANFLGKKWDTTLTVALFDDDGAVELAALAKVAISDMPIRMVLPRRKALELYEALGRVLLGT